MKEATTVRCGGLFTDFPHILVQTDVMHDTVVPLMLHTLITLRNGVSGDAVGDEAGVGRRGMAGSCCECVRDGSELFTGYLSCGEAPQHLDRVWAHGGRGLMAMLEPAAHVVMWSEVAVQQRLASGHISIDAAREVMIQLGYKHPF